VIEVFLSVQKQPNVLRDSISHY